MEGSQGIEIRCSSATSAYAIDGRECSRHFPNVRYRHVTRSGIELPSPYNREEGT